MSVSCLRKLEMRLIKYLLIVLQNLRLNNEHSLYAKNSQK